MIIAYVNMDDKFENVISYSTSGGFVKVIQDNPAIDILKLGGYKLDEQEDGYHLIFDEEKYNAYILE